MKRRIILGSYGLFIALGVAFGMFVHADSPKVTLGGDTYEAVVVDTPELQQKGLSGRKFLPQKSAMLFAFDAEDQRCFWMKDMHFPIDIIWVDDGRRVTHVERAVSPATYPQTFCPKAPAKYVIEVNSRRADAVRPGDIVHIQY
jgi:uncharacterized membrane protein (UPF0127 family)